MLKRILSSTKAPQNSAWECEKENFHLNPLKIVKIINQKSCLMTSAHVALKIILIN